MKQVKIFDYIPVLDAFYVTKEYKEIAEQLGLAEWTYVVWIGRLFTMDDDYGEHWFDNWDERAAIESKAKALGYDSDWLYIIDPTKFKDGKDGPCHSDAERKAFWTDVLKSLTLSIDTLGMIALYQNPPVGDEDHVFNLKKKIRLLLERYGKQDMEVK